MGNERKQFIITPQAGLILEGGGMRGVFTCGVLDYLMDNNIQFKDFFMHTEKMCIFVLQSP